MTTNTQKIEIINKFTGSKKTVEVNRDRAFEALNHYRSLWSTQSARMI